MHYYWSHFDSLESRAGYQWRFGLMHVDFETGKRLAVKVFANGAFITGKAEECDLYVYAEGENGQRLKSAMERNAKLMTASELEEYLAGK